MAGYIRQSSFIDGDTITAALFNNEYNQLVNAFSNTSGHKHDGTTAEGPVIGLIGDAGETSPNNKVLIDTTNNYIEFYVEVSSAPVQQLYIADGAIIPVTDSDIDLGTTSLRFKDTYTDTVTTTGNVSVGGNLTVTGDATISGNLTFGDADTDSINLAAEIDSNIVPNTDDTYDLGTTTKEWRNLYIDGTANIDSLVADTADINGGTIDGATIATSDITVGSGKTLDVSSGTLTLADDQISGDKVEGGTIAATTVTTLTSTTGNITNVNATTVDSTNLEVTNLKAKDGTAAGSIADSTGVVTLASSVLTTTDINGGTIDGATIATSDITVGTGKTLDVSSGTLTLADNQISGDKVEGGTIAATTITDLTFGSLNDGTITVTAFVDEDNMVSNSATLVPTQQSVKAYVDSQVTAQDLDFQGDTGGALSIDLDSESLTIAGGTGIDTSGATNTLTVAIDSTVATLTGTQTLTNKTLTTPVISSISNTGTLTLPTSTDTLVGRATTDTLTNKTLTSPVLNTGVSGTAFLDDDTFATASATTLASSESIKAYVDTEVGAIVTDVVSDTTPQLGGTLDTNGNLIQFGDSSGATDDRLQFGASQDLQIYHDGSTNDSIITESGAGNLVLQGNSLRLTNISGVRYLQGNSGAEVNLWYAGSKKLETTSTGIDVTGTVVADGLTLGDNTTSEIPIYFNSSSTDFSVGANGNNFIVAQTTGDLDTNQLVIVSQSGNVGVGLSPSYSASGRPSLEIGGSTQGNLAFNGSGKSGLIITNSAHNGSAFVAVNTGVSSAYSQESGEHRFFSAASVSAGAAQTFTEHMRINSSGNVGIGGSTITDVNLLNIQGSGASKNIGVVFNDTNTSKIFAIQNGGSALKFFDYTASAERMRIDSSGNVGIGTSSPSSKLTLSDTSANSIVQTRFINDARNYALGVHGGVSDSFVLYDETAGATRLVVDTSGRLLLGTTTEGEASADNFTIEDTGSAGCGMTIRSGTAYEGKIFFSDGTSGADEYQGYMIYNHSNNSFALGTAGSERMRIDSNGKVLINNTDSSPRGYLNLRGAVANNVTTLLSFDDMGIRGAGTAQAIDFVMGRTGFISEDACASLRGVCENDSSTSVSHNLGFEFHTGVGTGQHMFMRLRANGGITQLHTDEVPTYGNPRVSNSIVLGPTTSTGLINGGLTNATALYNKSGELYATDSSLNNTQLTPHNWTLISDGPSEELAWTYWSQRPSPDNKEITQSINVDIAKVVRKVEDLVGEKLIYTENSNMDDHTHQNIIADIQSTLADLTTRIEALEG